jgi:hypothetical protein
MTPKEKAIEIYTKMFDQIFAYYATDNLAKECAILAVDEIIIALNFHQWQNTKQIDYYIEVRQEIEKL